MGQGGFKRPRSHKGVEKVVARVLHAGGYNHIVGQYSGMWEEVKELWHTPKQLCVLVCGAVAVFWCVSLALSNKVLYQRPTSHTSPYVGAAAKVPHVDCIAVVSKGG